jgi:hypothetical protein
MPLPRYVFEHLLKSI